MIKWIANNPDSDIIQKLMKGCCVTSLTATVLASKGFSTAEEVMKSLKIKELSNPFLIKDMQKAVDVINSAINNGEKICIYGDYDCDGIMSTVIMYSYLKEVGADVIYYIPERSEGYGLNVNAIDAIHSEGVQIILTVDNGIAAVSEADYIYSLGMRLVITDHHQQGETLPQAEAIIDPHRHDCTSPFKYMCGAGLALKLVAALDGGNYTIALEQFADLAALATVADIVSITGENRYLVSYGMRLIENTDRPALMALKEICKIKKSVDTDSIGFRISPRINAAGRFGSPKQAVELFLCEDYENALSMAQNLDELNEKRRREEAVIMNDIYRIIDENPDIVRERVIFICGSNWHHGVIGIVAARIEEHFGKPCFIATETSDGEIRGSARAFGEFSVFGALSYAAETLEKFGGHQSAGGFTIKSGMKEDFKNLLEKYALENHKKMPLLTVCADAVLTSEMINIKNINDLNLLEPYGEGNEKPCFIIENAFINEVIPLSDGKHSKLRIEIEKRRFEALAFFTSPDSLIVKSGDLCDMVVKLSINEFNGNTSINFIIQDIRPHSFQQNKYFSARDAFESFTRGEELPANYYRAMLPTHSEAVMIYKAISGAGVSSDKLYMKFCPALNYCKFSVAVEALRQLGIITVSSSDSVIKKTVTDKKSDFYSAPVISALMKKTGR
ncbi:MAG: single-stranded-DNA-specific exonuclease RecJ [Prevotella sp.]|nr:single-stranded-DNA-specific exonuclease RecJ [Alistipes senegalensis]MCM1358168.1 single-stranded-DNA-specific exonuclease RecJ [Prevotella sp.]